ncbi:histidine phosphatase family protein [bacterium]|nr:histidine phosphatase family protein [bacterium]
MKTLILFRHAKSSWKDLDLDDFDRPLNDRGKRDAPVMGAQLAERGKIPDLIISSPAKRAFKTAKIVAKAVGYARAEIQTDERIYDATVSNLLQVLHGIDERHRTVILVGHNPGLNALSHYLTEYEVENIPTCGVFEVEFVDSRWSEVGKKLGRLVSFDYPKKNKTRS